MDTSILVAGSDLDDRMAEQVMGWHKEESAGFWPKRWAWYDAEGYQRREISEWRPSTYWGDAGEIVDRFAAEQRYLWLSYEAKDYSGLRRGMHWRCTFAAPEKFQAAADTPMLAICRAALLAKSLLTRVE